MITSHKHFRFALKFMLVLMIVNNLHIGENKQSPRVDKTQLYI